MESRVRERAALTIAILGGLVWASFAPTSLLFGVYLKSLGASYTSIGLLMTIASVFSSSLQVAFGAMADRYRNRKAIISATLLLRTLASFMLLFSRDVISISIWYVGTSLFLSGFMPLAQSIVADLSEGRRLGFSMGRYRLFGSVGWAVSCVLTGLLARDNLWNIFPITFVFSGVSFLISLALSEVKSVKEWRPEVARDKTHIAATLVPCFIASILLSGLSMGAATSFLSISLTQLGSDPLFLGVVIAVGAFFEVPAMYLSGRLSDRIGSLPVLIVGEVGLSVIYWLYGTVRDLYSYILIQGIRGTIYAIFMISGMSVSSSLGGSERGSTYAGLYNLSLYLGMALGPYLGGLISDSLGLWAMFMFSSAFSLTSAVVLLVPWALGKRA